MVLAIGLVSALAVLMITIGGFQYITSDSFNGKSEGKEKITNAVYGLLLILISIVFLGTIDSDLLKIRFGLSPIQINAGNLIGVDVQPLDPENKGYCISEGGNKKQCDFENSLECESAAKKEGISLNKCKSVNAVSYCRTITTTRSTGGKTLGSTTKKRICYTNQAQCEQANNNAPLRQKSTCKRESDFDEKDKNASNNEEILALYDQKDKLEKRKKELQYKAGTYKDTFFCNGKTCYPNELTCKNKATALSGGLGGPVSCVPYTKKKKELEGELEEIKNEITLVEINIKNKTENKNNPDQKQ